MHCINICKRKRKVMKSFIEDAQSIFDYDEFCDIYIMWISEQNYNDYSTEIDNMISLLNDIKETSNASTKQTKFSDLINDFGKCLNNTKFLNNMYDFYFLIG